MGWLPELGDVVLGKYRIVRSLGQGGMGVVFEAVNVVGGGHVALKMLKPALDAKTQTRSSRLKREARAVAKLRSRFVAAIIDFDFMPDGAPVLVMDLLTGRDLGALLRQTPRLGVEDALSYVIQACAGVAEAHALGIIHRDLKPANLFVDERDGAVRVLDFGLSKELTAETDLTGSHEAIGTLGFMSPEQASAGTIDARSDVWALGVVLYRLLMGKMPLTEKGYGIALRLLDNRPLPRVERDDVPAELVAVVACALEKDPARRYTDAARLGRALGPFVRRPSPATELALSELAGVETRIATDPRASTRPVPTPRGSDPRTSNPFASTPPAPSSRRSSQLAPAPPAARRRSKKKALITGETRTLLLAAAALIVATILFALASRR